uniref:Reelin domain-containing protein n=1 Tax=Hydatigena taeniaeformis TaxID=6205 RepID=A0A0R3X7H9_HYDTA
LEDSMYSTIPPAKPQSPTALSSCRIRSSKSSVQFKYRYVAVDNSLPFRYVWVVIFCTLTMPGPSEQFTQGLNFEPSARVYKQQQKAESLTPFSNLLRPRVATTNRRITNWLLPIASQNSKINFEFFNTWIYSVANSFSTFPNCLSGGDDSRTQTIQLKSGVGDFDAVTAFPVFRFYNSETRAYISRSNSTSEVVAQTHDPFSQTIEWEWIPQPQNFGAFLRNKATKHFLCFNKHGRPTVRKRINLRRCLLHGFLPSRELAVAEKLLTSPHRASSPEKSHVTLNSEFQLQTTITATNISSNSSKSKEVRRSPGRDYPPRSDNFAKFSIPVAVHLASKLHSPPWYIGFCPNGHAFANRKPYMAVCPNYRLSKRWNLLYICPPIPNQCRRPECRSIRRTVAQTRECPRACHFSIYCGDMPNVFISVNP